MRTTSTWFVNIMTVESTVWQILKNETHVCLEVRACMSLILFLPYKKIRSLYECEIFLDITYFKNGLEWRK